MSEQFDNFFNVFIEESRENFEDMNNDLVKLEDNPNDEELLYSILRHVHTLKGSAGLFEFTVLKVIAHRLEDLMVLLQENPKDVNREIMDILFEGMDIMQTHVQNITIESGGKDTFSKKEKNFLERLNSITSMISSGALDLKDAVIELIHDVEHLLPALDSITETSSLQARIKNVQEIITEQVNTEKALTTDTSDVVISQFMGDIDIGLPLKNLRDTIGNALEKDLTAEEAEEFFKDLEPILSAANALGIPTVNDIVTEVNESIEMFASLMLDFDSMQGEYYQNILVELQPYITVPSDAEEIEEEAAAIEEIEEKPVKEEQVVSSGRKTVRIEETKIDTFLDSVGELIILGEVFNNLLKRFSEAFTGNLNLIREFKTTNNSYSQHIFALQESLMEVRRVELRNITGNLNRLVRDAAKSVSKPIDLQIEGEEAVVDKSLLDDINTCLVHILRNAVDHGIETTQVRIDAGKPETGTIAVKAENEDGFFLLRVTDDGAGINTGKLRDKMTQSGNFSPEEVQSMPEKDVWKQIFNDGMSTATEVTDISGRGVGMAVVMDNISRMNGVIDIQSTPGSGTEVTLRIPLTVMLSVIDGLVIQVGKESFIIPIRHVQESFNPQKDQIKTVARKGECAILRETIYPLLRLSDFFDIPGKEGDNSMAVGILVKNEHDQICLLVDNIVDHQQVVIKTIEGLNKMKGIYGGALLGDGTIGLVLDIDAIIGTR